MVDALVFNPGHSLDFQEIRHNVVRVPEVMLRLRQAQSIWDKHASFCLDLTSFISGDDSYFLSNIRLKSLASAIVQVGLYDRVIKNGLKPAYIFGVANQDSALKVAIGEQSFDELILQSQSLRPRGVTHVSVSALPVLAGVSLNEYALYQKKGETFVELVGREMDLRRLLVEETRPRKINRFIVVGPGDQLVQTSLRSRPSIKVIDSVEFDPFLSWFWSTVQIAQVESAQ